MLLLELDANSRDLKYRQIIEAIGRMIDERVLRPGERLPSTRRLARALEQAFNGISSRMMR